MAAVHWRMRHAVQINFTAAPKVTHVVKEVSAILNQNYTHLFKPLCRIESYPEYDKIMFLFF